MVRLTIRLFLFALFIYGGVRSYYYLTDDFRMGNLIFEREYRPEWDTSSSVEPYVREILSQDFAYVNKGAQSYAFQSEDGKYILKLFKFKHIRPLFLVTLLPDIGPFTVFKQHYFAKREERLQKMFEGYLLAFQRHQKESGLLYLHLNPTTTLGQTVTLYDKLGISHSIDLDRLAFVLQRRAVRADETLRRLLDRGEVTDAKRYLNGLLALLKSEYAMGIHDSDRGILRNTGFIGEKPIHFDVGELSEQDVKLSDLKKNMNDLHQWILNNYPDIYPELASEITQFVEEVEGVEARAS